MRFRFTAKTRLAVIAAVVFAFSVQAQQGGQPIIFSTPQKSDDSSAPSLSPQHSALPDIPDAFDAPQPILRATVSPQTSPPQIISSAQLREMQEEKKNWILMTPEEIFGVATSETNAQNQTQVERYLERQNHLQPGATNSLNNHADSPWNFSHDRQDDNLFNADNVAAGNKEQSLNGLLDDNSENQMSGQRNDSDENFSDATRQQQILKSDLARQAEMERFQQLLNPQSAMFAPSPNDNLPSSKPTVDPYVTQPDFTPNPAGASFTPVTSSAGRPMGLTPLPQLISPASSQPATTPAWAPQPAPWLSQTPQLFTVPQRKF